MDGDGDDAAAMANDDGDNGDKLLALHSWCNFLSF